MSYLHRTKQLRLNFYVFPVHKKAAKVKLLRVTYTQQNSQGWTFTGYLGEE